MVDSADKDSFEEALGKKVENGKPREKAKVLKQHNTTQFESPPNTDKRGPVLPMPPTKVTEADLASDSEDETGRHSDGSSIHIDDDMEIDQEIVTESDPVGTAPRTAQFGIIIEFNSQNTTVVKLQGGHNMSTATMNVAP